MVKPVIHDPILLARVSEPAVKEDWAVAQDLLETLVYHKEGCVGMAANMIGIRKNVIIVNMGMLDVVMFNPVILKADGSYETEEGCLSLPGESGVTCRPAVVRVKAQDRNGKWCVYKGEGLKARCFCHEIDHLDGILYKDKLDEGEVLYKTEAETE